MSGGGRRGEVRIRKARPVQKQSGGTHNRAARRASKAQQRAPLSDAEAEEFSRKRRERRRAEREALWAGKTDADILDMSLERSEKEGAGLGGDWFLGLLLTAVPMWAHRHYRTDPTARERRAHELGDAIAFSQASAAISDPDARCSAKGEISKVFNAIAEGIAIGAYSPGGTSPFMGLVWEVVGSELRVTNRAFCARYRLDDDAFWAEDEAA